MQDNNISLLSFDAVKYQEKEVIVKLSHIKNNLFIVTISDTLNKKKNKFCLDTDNIKHISQSSVKVSNDLKYIFTYLNIVDVHNVNISSYIFMSLPKLDSDESQMKIICSEMFKQNEKIITFDKISNHIYSTDKTNKLKYFDNPISYSRSVYEFINVSNISNISEMICGDDVISIIDNNIIRVFDLSDKTSPKEININKSQTRYDNVIKMDIVRNNDVIILTILITINSKYELITKIIHKKNVHINRIDLGKVLPDDNKSNTVPSYRCGINKHSYYVIFTDSFMKTQLGICSLRNITSYLWKYINTNKSGILTSLAIDNYEDKSGQICEGVMIYILTSQNEIIGTKIENDNYLKDKHIRHDLLSNLPFNKINMNDITKWIKNKTYYLIDNLIVSIFWYANKLLKLFGNVNIDMIKKYIIKILINIKIVFQYVYLSVTANIHNMIPETIIKNNYVLTVKEQLSILYTKRTYIMNFLTNLTDSIDDDVDKKHKVIGLIVSVISLIILTMTITWITYYLNVQDLNMTSMTIGFLGYCNRNIDQIDIKTSSINKLDLVDQLRGNIGNIIGDIPEINVVPSEIIPIPDNIDNIKEKILFNTETNTEPDINVINEINEIDKNIGHEYTEDKYTDIMQESFIPLSDINIDTEENTEIKVDDDILEYNYFDEHDKSSQQISGLSGLSGLSEHKSETNPTNLMNLMPAGENDEQITYDDMVEYIKSKME